MQAIDDMVLGEFKGAWCIYEAVFEEAMFRAEGMEASELAALPEPNLETEQHGNVEIIGVNGGLTKHPHPLQAFIGGTSSEQVRARLREIEAGDEVEAVVLQIDSPGGHASGIGALGDTIDAMDTPVIAYVEDGMAASAAYWVASQADQVVANRHAHVGSIGVFALHLDASTFFEDVGIQAVLMRTGENKGDFAHPAIEVTDEMKGERIRLIETIQDKFVGAVARGRGMDEADVRALATGQVFTAERALDEGLVDAIGTRDQAVQEAFQATSSSTPLQSEHPLSVTGESLGAANAGGEDIGHIRMAKIEYVDEDEGTADVEETEDESSTSQPLSTDKQGMEGRGRTMENEDGDGPSADEEPSRKDLLEAVHGLNENVDTVIDKMAEIDSRVSQLEEAGIEPDEDVLDKLEERRKIKSKQEQAARVMGCEPEELAGTPEGVLDKILDNPEGVMDAEPLVNIPDAEEGAESASVLGLNDQHWYQRSKENQKKAEEKLSSYGKGGS